MSQKQNTLVLVADDEPSMLALVSAFVRSKGYTVIEASDGDMAWQLAHERLPDLVILDVMMPGMSGWEVCRKIRDAVSLAHTGVIMLTGIGENLNEMTSPLYGADTYIDKPFEFAHLERGISETLKKRKKGIFGRADGADQVSSDDDDMDDVPSAAPDSVNVPAPKPAKARPAKAPSKKTAKKAPSKKASPAVTKKTTKKARSKKASQAVVKKAAKRAGAKKAAAPKLAVKATVKKAATKKPKGKATNAGKAAAVKRAKTAASKTARAKATPSKPKKKK